MSDANVLMFYLNISNFVAVFLLTFLASIFLHELGHLLVLRKHSKKARVYFKRVKGKLKLTAGKESDYLGLSNKELMRVYYSGIFLGAVPVALFTIVNLWGIVLFVAYLLGCGSDFSKIKRLDSGN